ncbi:hypothetical protein ANCCEY_15116, partial [Ancylostoma ceylanicum]
MKCRSRELSELRSASSTPSTPPPRPAFHPQFRGSLRLPLRSPTSAALSKCSSDDSLEDYVAPKMGEPGVPGTRDLNFSLRMLKARRKTLASSETAYQPLLESLVPRQLSRWSQRRRFPHGQVEQDYAKFLHRKGLPPSSFFSQQPSAKTSKPKEEPWIDYSVVLGQDHQRLVRAYRGAATIGLGALKVSEQSGVLSRAE